MNSIELLKTDLLTWSGAHEGKFKLAFDKGLSTVTSGRLNYEQYLEKLVFYKGAEALKALEEAMSPATRAALIADGHIKVKPTSQQEVLPTNTLANEKAAEPAASENAAKPADHVALNELGLPVTQQIVTFDIPTFSACYANRKEKIGQKAKELAEQNIPFKWSSYKTGVTYILLNEVHKFNETREEKLAACNQWVSEFTKDNIKEFCGTWNGETGKWLGKKSTPKECICFRQDQGPTAIEYCMGDFLDKAHEL